MTSGMYWVLATQNAKKAKELVALSEGSVEVKTLKDIGLDDLEIIEDGDSFKANAYIKAHTVLTHLQENNFSPMPQWVVADDSGLCVFALEGAPGIRSARYASDAGFGEGDDDNNDLLFKSLEQSPQAKDRKAFFACAVCAVSSRGERKDFYGEVHGTIAHGLTGDGGFGYDPLFIPDAYPDYSMAELTATQKHAISHRGLAMRELCKALIP